MKEYTYKDPTGISRLVVTLLIAGAVLNAVAAFSSYLEYELVASVRDGFEVTEERVNANDNRQMIIGISQVVLFIATAIFFGRWIYRIGSNAHCFSSLRQRHSPGWAVGYYFVPVLNLWRPYQALRDAYEAFIDLARDNKYRVVFPLWWAAWLVSGFLGRITFNLSMRAEELDELMQASLVTVASDCFDVFLDVMAILLVLMVTKACLAHEKRQRSEQTHEVNLAASWVRDS